MIFQSLLVGLMAVASLAMPHHGFLHEVDFPGDGLADGNKTDPVPPSVAASAGAGEIVKRELGSPGPNGGAILTDEAASSAAPNMVTGQGASKPTPNNDLSPASTTEGASTIVQPCHSKPAPADSPVEPVVIPNVRQIRQVTETAVDEESSQTPNSSPIASVSDGSIETSAIDNSTKLSSLSPGNSDLLTKEQLLRSIIEQTNVSAVDGQPKSAKCQCPSGQCSGEMCGLADYTSVASVEAAETAQSASDSTEKQSRVARSLPEQNKSDVSAPSSSLQATNDNVSTASINIANNSDAVPVSSNQPTVEETEVIQSDIQLIHPREGRSISDNPDISNVSAPSSNVSTTDASIANNSDEVPVSSSQPAIEETKVGEIGIQEIHSRQGRSISGEPDTSALSSNVSAPNSNVSTTDASIANNSDGVPVSSSQPAIEEIKVVESHIQLIHPRQGRSISDKPDTSALSSNVSAASSNVSTTDANVASISDEVPVSSSQPAIEEIKVVESHIQLIHPRQGRSISDKPDTSVLSSDVSAASSNVSATDASIANNSVEVPVSSSQPAIEEAKLVESHIRLSISDKTAASTSALPDQDPLTEQTSSSPAIQSTATVIRRKRAPQETLDDLITLSDEEIAPGSGETAVPTTASKLAPDTPEGFPADDVLLERSRRLYSRSVPETVSELIEPVWFTSPKDSESEGSDPLSTAAPDTGKEVGRDARQAQINPNIDESTSKGTVQENTASTTNQVPATGGASVSPQMSAASPQVLATRSDQVPENGSTVELPKDVLPNPENMLNNDEKELARTRYARDVQEDGSGLEATSTSSTEANQVLGKADAVVPQAATGSDETNLTQTTNTPADQLTRGGNARHRRLVTYMKPNENEASSVKTDVLKASTPAAAAETVATSALHVEQQGAPNAPKDLTANETDGNVVAAISSPADATKVSAGAAEPAANDTIVAADAANTAANATEVAANTNKVAARSIEVPENTTQIAANSTKVAADATKNAANATIVAANASKTAATAMKTAANATEAAANATVVAANAPQIAANATKVAANPIQVAAEATKTAGGVPQNKTKTPSVASPPYTGDHYGNEIITHRKFYRPVQENTTKHSKNEHITKVKQEAAKEQEARRLGENFDQENVPDLGNLDIRTMGGNQLDIDLDADDDDKQTASVKAMNQKTSSADRLGGFEFLPLAALLSLLPAYLSP